MQKIVHNFKTKCQEANRNCSFYEMAPHSTPKTLAAQICNLAEEQGVESIWMGSKRRGLDLPFGRNTSISSAVSQLSPCSVYIVKDPELTKASKGEQVSGFVPYFIDKMMNISGISKTNGRE